MTARRLAARGVRGAAAAMLVVLVTSLGLVVPPPDAVRAAEYSLSTAAIYEVSPSDRDVQVTVKVNFRNTTPNPPGRFSVFEVIDLAVHAGARGVRATDDRGRLTVTLDRRQGVNVASVRPRKAVRFREITRFTLRYTLPDGSGGDVRIRPSVVIFPVWSFGTKGSVEVRLPSDYEVLVDGDPLTAERAGSNWRLESGAVDDPTRWLALLTATLPSSYATLARSVPLAAGTVDLQVRAWSDDRAWGRRTLNLAAAALPPMEAELGLPYPPGPLVIVQSLPGSGGPLSEPAPGGADIGIGFEEPPFTVLHQLAHAWLSPALAKDRWMREGFASRAAAAVAGELDVKPPYVAASEARAQRASGFPLVSWGAREFSAAQDRYAYAASWAVANQLSRRVGADAMRMAWRRIAAGVDAYLPLDPDLAPAALPGAPADSRHLLDQLEAVSGSDLSRIFEEWVFDPATNDLLPARAAARAAHAELLRAAGDWGTPEPVRLALAGWRFADAEVAIAEATQWLQDRDRLLHEMAGAGLSAPQRLRDEYEASGGSQAGRGELEAEASVVVTYARASALAGEPTSFVDRVGLLGGDDLTAALAEARAAFAEGDLIGAADLSAQVNDRLQRAGQNGLVRLASGIAVVIALLVLAFRFTRGRGRAATSGYTARP